MSTRPVSRVAASAMLCAATALWTTFGAIAFADARVGAERVGVLPPLGFFVAFIAAAVATLVIARPTARVVAPLWLSALALVPWLPVPLPLSAFLWSGAIRIWLWVAIAAALIALAPRPRGVRPWSPRRNAAIAGLLAGLAYGLGAMLREEHHRLAVELFAICASYFFAVAAFHMWWGGFSAPARFLVPIALALAIPTAIWFKTRAHPASRIAGVAALAASLLATATIASVDRGALLFNAHDGASRLAMWWSSAVDLTTALPSLVQRPPVVVLIESAVWLLALAATVWIGVMVERRGRSRSAIVVSMGFTLAVTTSAAVSLVWRGNGAMPVAPASGGSTILRRLDTGSRQLAIRYSPLERLRLDEVAGRITLLRMSYPIDTVAVLNGLPAGVYEVSGRARGSAAGCLRIATERESPPIEDWQMVSLGPSWKRTFVLPVPVSRLRIGADEAAQRALADISIRPLVVPGPRNRLTEDGEAGRGARYGRAVVFRIAGSSYFEPTGFWVLGGTVGEFAVAPDPHSAIRLFVRNAPVDNEVTLESGSWREHWTLAPGEERIVDLPVDARRLGAILTIQSLRGARPVDFDPNSDDERLLGCWIEFR